LESLVTFADVHDVVTLEPGGEGGVTVGGPFAQHIGGENLLARALALLREADPELRLGSIRLDKHLPVAAGLGGGSADAAALLRAVQRTNAGRAGAPWLQIAARLGADVPVCLQGRPSLMCGKGDILMPVVRLPQVPAVLVNPGQPLPTARVFAALDATPVSASRSGTAPVDLADIGVLLDYMRARGNDLEPPALELLPVIGELKTALETQPDCRIAAMSGSGPTCFGIFSTASSAHRAADNIASSHPDWWVKSTFLRGCPG
jgi:4-diphosphocytidyl-2-C-methyl-D-erythritol kinase